jgi:hypothetical protein
MTFYPISTSHPVPDLRDLLDRFEKFVKRGVPDHPFKVDPAGSTLVLGVILNLYLCRINSVQIKSILNIPQEAIRQREHPQSRRHFGFPLEG